MTLKSFVASIFAFAVVSPLSAAVMEVGYCNGEVSSQTVSKVGNCDVSAAIVLTPDVLAKYKGADIKGVRLYLATIENLENLTAWVREDLSGENIASCEAIPQEGWQEISFETSLKVGDTPLAVGYTVNQTKSSRCIALGGDVDPFGHYYAKRGEWEEIKAPKGSVCVELIVEGDMVPASDLEVVSLSLENPVVKTGNPFILKARVRNSSLSEIGAFSYSVVNTMQNCDVVGGTCPESLQPKESVEIEVTVPSDDFIVNHATPVMFVVEDDGLIDNNSKIISAGKYDEAFPRKLLLEEFTTEQCPNCPRAINCIATAMEDGYADKMVVVAHHVGFYTDWLTLPEEEELIWFYGDEGSYAPAGMFDRTVRTPDLVTPVEQIGYYDTFSSRLDEAIDKPGFVRIDIDAFRSDDEIKVNVEAEAHPLLNALLDQPYITILLIEDGIRHHKQAGIGNPDFTHSHVSRAYLTHVLGDSFMFDENGKLIWNGSIAVGADWNLENMEAVAFVHAYNSDDRTGCQVYNVSSSHIETSGVEGIASDSESVGVEYFDIQGRSLSAPCEGVTIIRRSFSDGSVRMEKRIR